jgi:hypothetical protein
MTNETKPLAVRVIYIVPADAEPWDDAKQRATECLEDIQWFFADEMERLGFGPKTFEIARDAAGSLFFHQINSNLSKDDFSMKYWNNCKNEAQGHGLRNLDYVTVYFYEAYSIADGEVDAGSKGQAKKGKGGEAFLSSLHLKMARREWLANNNGYCGEVFNWISSESMKGYELSWNGRGRELGDLSGSGFGVIAHEIAHCFALPEEEKMSRNRNGPLMGNGCRGMRGYFRPDLTKDRCVLREKDAAVLDKSDYFEIRKLKLKSSSFSR